MSDVEPEHASTDEPVVATEQVVEEPPVERDVEEPPVEEVAPAPPARTAADGYAFAAVTCAAAGLLLPLAISLISGRRGFVAFAIVLLSAPAALLLARATEEPINTEPVSPAVARISAVAQTLAYASIALVVTFCAALLFGILWSIITG